MLSGINTIDISENDYNNLEEKTKDVLRKLIVAKMLSGRRVISVTGEQGAGKSTLIRNLYDLDDGILSVREGRGEKLPIIISEHDSDEYIFLAGRLQYDDGKGSVKEEKVEREIFSQLSEGEDPNVLYIELRVPLRHLGDSSSAFMLLPGFEDKAEYWQELIDFSVACSDSCIFVYTASMLAGAGSRDVAKKVYKLLDKDTKPIFAVSFSESLMENPQVKEELVCNSLEAFHIPLNEKDRVVFVGNQGPDKNKVWIDALINSCAKYVIPTNVTRAAQKNYVEKIIHDNLKVILSDLEKVMNNFKQREQIADLENEKFLQAFERENKKARKALEENLKQVLEAEKVESSKEIDKLFKEQGGIQDNFFLRAREWVFGPNAKDILAREDVLRRIMYKNTSEDEVSRVASAFYTALERTTSKSSDELKHTIGRLYTGQANQQRLLDSKSYEGQNTDETQKSLICIFNDITQVLKSDTNINENVELLQTKNIRGLAQTIQWMATYVFTKQLSMGIEHSMSALKEIQLTNNEIKLPSLDEVSKDSRKIVVGLLGLVGVDFIPDQSINFPIALAEALGVSTTIMYTVIGAASLAVFGAAVHKEFNKRQINELMSLRRAASQNYSSAQEKCLQEYDAYMDSIREKLCLYIEKVYGLGRAETKVLNMKILLERIGRDFDDISEQISQSEVALSSILY
jgi:hypothetical protein